MKKITISLFTLMSLMAFLSLSSCKKVWDIIKEHPDGTADNCKIDKVAFKWNNIIDDGANINDTAKVSYNSNGDPTSVLYASGGKTGSVWNDKAFKYDSQHRLIAYLENAVPSLDYGLFWHRYTYVSATSITDTVFVYANGDFFSLDRPIYAPGEIEIRIQRYTLDTYGRVIKFVSDSGDNYTYSYDSNGNLIKPGTTYTNKTNIKQTHKTWMFIAKDYSVNAPNGQATQYNSNKLPTKADAIDIFTDGFYWDQATLGSRNIRIEYICH